MRGSCIHTLKDKLFEHHIWRNIRWWVKCWRGVTVSSLYFIYRYSQTHIDTQRPHHHMLIIMTWKIKILNIYVYFYFKFSWQVFASTQWNGKKNITTYWQTSLPGLNDEQVQFFFKFSCVRRCPRPHIHRQTKTPSHTDGLTADGLNAEHVQMFLDGVHSPHIDRQTKTLSHTE